MKTEPNILIIKSNKDDFEKFFLEHMQTTGVSTQPIYKFSRGLGWAVQVIWMEILHLPFQQIWYGSWKDKLSSYDMIIVFDRNLSWRIIPYIKRKSGKRIIAWYWNIVKRPFPKKYLKYCEVWSFDEGDCEKYSYKKNIQFYFKEAKLNSANIVYDVLFVGRDKNRYDILLGMKAEMEALGLKTNIMIVKDNTSRYYNKRKYSDVVSYKQILDMISQSKSIIEVSQEGQSGITIRLLEAIFYKKKLILTDSSVREQTYYSSNNMYIWKKDERDLRQFINMPICDELIDSINDMSFEKWIDNFYL